jgi:hypothetical protein
MIESHRLDRAHSACGDFRRKGWTATGGWFTGAIQTLHARRIPMRKKQFVPAALSALLLVTPLAIAQQVDQPQEGTLTTGKDATAQASAPASGETPSSAGAMVMGSQGMMGQGTTGSAQTEDSSGTGSSTGPGRMMGGPGGGTMPGMMMGAPGGGTMPGMTMGRGMGKGVGMGMMRPGMMGQMQGGDGGQAARMMGPGGKMGMMQGVKGGGMKGHRACGDHPGHGMRENRRKLMGRLDLLEARMAKIETMLERLLER